MFLLTFKIIIIILIFIITVCLTSKVVKWINNLISATSIYLPYGNRDQNFKEARKQTLGISMLFGLFVFLILVFFLI